MSVGIWSIWWLCSYQTPITNLVYVTLRKTAVIGVREPDVVESIRKPFPVVTSYDTPMTWLLPWKVQLFFFRESIWLEHITKFPWLQTTFLRRISSIFLDCTNSAHAFQFKKRCTSFTRDWLTTVFEVSPSHTCMLMTTWLQVWIENLISSI